ncbi:STM3941 family protein [Robertkochia solimangrovi]|uniref:STM3941 family protein n=1 Tax=Robertkochia solimangrovi TaxID=2213046 RepID=UPI001F549BBB|nr:STM3941 family protein [Robertkochia solimangrovi]
MSRNKILLQILGCILFVSLGIHFILNPEVYMRGILGKKPVIITAGIAAVLFFGLCLIFIVKKLFDKNAGLIIDEKGITDNSNATSVGLIAWEDITEIHTLEIVKTRMLILETDKPEKYIERAKGMVAKRAMKTNYESYGSPISIISTTLKINFRDLEKTVLEAYNQHKQLKF